MIVKIKIKNWKLKIILTILICFFVLPKSASAATIIGVSSSLGLTSGLVGHWTFDGPDISGTSAIDKSGSDKTGTITGATKAIGKLGQALQFDGSEDYVSFSYLRMTDFTISTWIKISKDYNNEQAITAYRGYPVLFIDGGETTTCEAGGTSTAGSVSFRTSGAGGEYLCGSTVVTDGQWHHIVVTREAENQVSIIIDNNLDISGVAFSFSDNVGLIGASDNRGVISHELNGLVDDVRVYDRILSAGEIKRLYNMGAGTKIGKTRTDTLTSGLIGHWTFDGKDIAGASAYDRSPVGTNTGTIYGAAKTIGKLGQGLSFDGTSNYVNNSNILISNISGYTVSLWAKSDGTPHAFNMPAGYGSASEHMWYFDHNAAKDKWHYSWKRGNGTQVSIYSDSTVNEGQWYHLVATNNGLNQYLYVDGVRQADTESSAGFDAANFSADIGTMYGSTGYMYDGAVDDVRVYNRALSADEIKRLYNMGR